MNTCTNRYGVIRSLKLTCIRMTSHAVSPTTFLSVHVSDENGIGVWEWDNVGCCCIYICILDNISSYTCTCRLAVCVHVHTVHVYKQQSTTINTKGTIIYGGTCGMMDILLRRSWSPSDRQLTPSILTKPSGSANLNNAAIREDFPAPVRPTIPTWNENISLQTLDT